MTNTTEIDASNPEAALAQLATLFNGLLMFTRQAIAHARSGGAVNDDELARIQAECLFKMRDSEASGLSIQDEALAINEGLRHLEEILSSIR
jgi:hypothetical protein